MKVILIQNAYIESIHGGIEVGKTEVYTVFLNQNEEKSPLESVTLYLKSETDYWWIERDEFKRAIADGHIKVVK